MKPTIEVHIEEMVVEGQPANEGHRIASAVERELRRLIADHGYESLTGRGDAAAIDAGTVKQVGEAGARVAQAIHGVRRTS